MSRGRGWDEPPLPGGERPHRETRWQLAGLGALAVATMVGAMLALMPPAGRLPLESLGGLSGKLADAEAHRGELDVFLVGSSRALRGVVPERIDAELAALGCPGVRSYNLGWAGMSAQTMARVAEVVSRGPSERPALVLIEPLAAFGPAFRLPGDPRARFGNRASTLPLGFLQIWARPAPGRFGEAALPTALMWIGLRARWAISAGLSWDYLLTSAVTQLGVGRVQRAIFSNSKPSDSRPAAMRAQRGYLSLEAVTADASGERRATLQRRLLDPVADRENFETVTRGMTEAALAPAEPLSWIERHFVEGLLASGDGPHSRAGALLPPTVRLNALVWTRDVAHHLEENAPELPVVHVPPNKLPELYKMEHWYDHGHLAESGAQLFSGAIARDLCPEIRAWIRTESR